MQTLKLLVYRSVRESSQQVSSLGGMEPFTTKKRQCQINILFPTGLYSRTITGCSCLYSSYVVRFFKYLLIASALQQRC
jgi:hypothetical protein